MSLSTGRSQRPPDAASLNTRQQPARVSAACGPAVDCEGRRSTAPLRQALRVLIDLGGDGRRSLPAGLPLGPVERRWKRHVVARGGVDRAYGELATSFALA